MSVEYLVTTKKSEIPTDKGKIIVMIDGTVPGWYSTSQDYHYDHHRKDGALVQCVEVPLGVLSCVKESIVFVTMSGHNYENKTN